MDATSLLKLETQKCALLASRMLRKLTDLRQATLLCRLQMVKGDFKMKVL